METNIRKSAVDLTDLALYLIVISLVVVIGGTIMTNVRDNKLTDLNVLTTSNETIARPTDSGIPLTNKWGKAVTECWNYTGSTKISSGNYTTSINQVDGTIKVINLTNSYPNQWNCTYQTYDTTRADYSVANKSLVGYGEFGNWFKIIVIIGIAAGILGLIFLLFGGGGQSQSQGGSY